MTSRYWVFGLRFALGAALSMSACQHDSNADFDDRNLTSPDVGGAPDSGGSSAVAGENPGGGSEAGGSEASGGSAGQGGKSSAGASGSASPTAGKGGTASAGGKGGSGGAAGGTTGQAGKTGQGGVAGTASNGGGMAGSSNPPEPVTLETADIDDTHVASCLPQMNFGEARQVMVDGSSSCKYEALIDVPRLELPAGALVSAATLTLVCSNAGGAITVAYANDAWKELTVRWSARPEVGATLGTITCAETGPVTIDLTAAFGAWLAGEHAAHGIYLRSEATDGTDFGSSEADKESLRPMLRITYTLPVK